MISSDHFEQLLNAAAAQVQPQRILFVFAAAELPSDATDEQQASFEAGEGGTLAPMACVDKAADEIRGFDTLVHEAREACPGWKVMFISTLAGQDGRPPSAERVDAALKQMVDGVRAGRFDGFMALNTAGGPVSFF